MIESYKLLLKTCVKIKLDLFKGDWNIWNKIKPSSFELCNSYVFYLYISMYNKLELILPACESNVIVPVIAVSEDDSLSVVSTSLLK